MLVAPFEIDIPVRSVRRAAQPETSFISNQRRSTALIIGLVGLVMLLALWGGSAGQTQETVSFVFEKIHATYQSVEVRDAEGSVLGSGDFRANVSSNRNGRMNGKMELQMPDFMVEIEFTTVDEIILRTAILLVWRLEVGVPNL